MRHRVTRILIVFTIVNAVGILVFYGWVISNQVRRPKQVSASGTIWSGGAGKRDWQNEIHNHQHQGSEHFEERGSRPLYVPSTYSKQPQNWHVIPPVPEHSESDHVPPLDAAVLQKYQEYPQKPPRNSVLILTPIHNVAGPLKRFLHLLQSLNYPHSLVSIAFGEDSSHDNTLHVAEDIAVELRKSFARVDLFHFNLTGQINGSWGTVHSRQNQFRRRQHLAQARNALLKAALGQQDWVLWIDSDVSYFPSDIIQQLLSAEKEIVVPLCIYLNSHRKKHVFDKNTWRETNMSLAYQKKLPAHVLIFEGYDSTQRLWLSDLRAEGRVVPIDGVGGCTLLIQSKCHREGLIFPESVFQHHIETEGLAKLARYMGYGVYGMPFVEVIH